ncbi:MAG TPA: hypothetical protein VF310_04165 [Vicinamibacteria bacterium]
MTSFVAPARAQQHVVSPEAAQARVAEAAAQRARQLAAVDAVLASPEAVAAAASLGQDAQRLRAAVPALSDQELRDLAARAEALQGDPVAGLDNDIRQLLIIFLIVAIVILVLQAVD